MMAVKKLFFLFLLVTFTANIIEAAILNSGYPVGNVYDLHKDSNEDCKTCSSTYYTTDLGLLTTDKELKEISNPDKNPDANLVLDKYRSAVLTIAAAIGFGVSVGQAAYDGAKKFFSWIG